MHALVISRLSGKGSDDFQTPLRPLQRPQNGTCPSVQAPAWVLGSGPFQPILLPWTARLRDHKEPHLSRSSVNIHCVKCMGNTRVHI